MKDQLHTYPVLEAFRSGDECPFCHLRDQAENKALDFILGGLGSYMQRDVRAATDKEGFCAGHMKSMFQYGNHLGSALTLQTYLIRLDEDFRAGFAEYIPEKRRILKRRKSTSGKSPVAALKERGDSCYICRHVDGTMTRYFETFFHMLKDAEFRALVEGSKGFCYPHFIQLMETAEEKLPSSRREWFYPTVIGLMLDNIERIKGDLDWFIQKFDHRFKDESWRDSKDALSRVMQKLRSVYPSRPPHREK